MPSHACAEKSVPFTSLDCVLEDVVVPEGPLTVDVDVEVTFAETV